MASVESERDAILVIHADTVAASHRSLQRFEPVPRGNAKVMQRRRGLHVVQLATHGWPQRLWYRSRPLRDFAVEDVFRCEVAERLNHRPTIPDSRGSDNFNNTSSDRRASGFGPPGIDAICQDIPLGGARDGLARAEVCHDTVVDLAGEEAFETPDDLASGSAIGGASGDVVAGGLVVPHADDDGAIEGRIGLSVPAPIEAVPAGGDPRRSGDGTRATEFRKGGFRANPVGVIAEEDQQRRRGIGTHPEARSEGGRRRGCESREVLLVRRDFFGKGGPAAGERPEGMLGGCGRCVKGAWSESGAAGEEPVIGEGVEGFTQRGRRVHDDLLQGDHRRSARLHRGIPRDLATAARS